MTFISPSPNAADELSCNIIGIVVLWFCLIGVWFWKSGDSMQFGFVIGNFYFGWWIGDHES